MFNTVVANIEVDRQEHHGEVVMTISRKFRKKFSFKF